MDIGRVKGIGPKLAKRLILELKDKITKGNGSDTALFVSPTNSDAEEAASALITLGFTKANVNISDGRIVSVDDSTLEGGRVFDFENCYIFPGFSDVHVHLREPG